MGWGDSDSPEPWEPVSPSKTTRRQESLPKTPRISLAAVPSEPPEIHWESGSARTRSPPSPSLTAANELCDALEQVSRSALAGSAVNFEYLFTQASPFNRVAFVSSGYGSRIPRCLVPLLKTPRGRLVCALFLSLFALDTNPGSIFTNQLATILSILAEDVIPLRRQPEATEAVWDSFSSSGSSNLLTRELLCNQDSMSVSLLSAFVISRIISDKPEAVPALCQSKFSTHLAIGVLSLDIQALSGVSFAPFTRVITRLYELSPTLMLAGSRVFTPLFASIAAGAEDSEWSLTYYSALLSCMQVPCLITSALTGSVPEQLEPFIGEGNSTFSANIETVLSHLLQHSDSERIHIAICILINLTEFVFRGSAHAAFVGGILMRLLAPDDQCSGLLRVFSLFRGEKIGNDVEMLQLVLFIGLFLSFSVTSPYEPLRELVARELTDEELRQLPGLLLTFSEIQSNTGAMSEWQKECLVEVASRLCEVIDDPEVAAQFNPTDTADKS